MKQIRYKRSAMRFINSINILDSIKPIERNDRFAHFLCIANNVRYIVWIDSHVIYFVFVPHSFHSSRLRVRCMAVCVALKVWYAKHRSWIQMRVSASVAYPSQNARKCYRKPMAVTNHCQKVCSGCCVLVRCQPKVKSSNCHANGPIALHCHNTLLPCWTICQTHCIQCRSSQQPSLHWITTANLPRPTHKYVYDD